MPNLSYASLEQQQQLTAPSLDTAQQQQQEEGDQSRDFSQEGYPPATNDYQDSLSDVQSQSQDMGYQKDNSLPIAEETMTKLEVAPPQAGPAPMQAIDSAPPAESDPLYCNEPMQPRPPKSLLDIDWLSAMSDSHAALGEQLEQVCLLIFLCVVISLWLSIYPFLYQCFSLVSIYSPMLCHSV